MTDKITFKEIFIKREYDIHLPGNPQVEVVIDAGANIGFTSVFFANQYPGARVISIEPDDENLEYLVQNTKAYANIAVIKGAVWSKKEKLNTVDHGYGKRGIMVEKTGSDNFLQAISINDVMKEFGITHIDILKMDIEGSEKNVFSENFDWLMHTKCLVIELHDRLRKGCSRTVFDAMAKLDFSLSIKGENLVFFNERFHP